MAQKDQYEKGREADRQQRERDRRQREAFDANAAGRALDRTGKILGNAGEMVSRGARKSQAAAPSVGRDQMQSMIDSMRGSSQQMDDFLQTLSKLAAIVKALQDNSGSMIPDPSHNPFYGPGMVAGPPGKKTYPSGAGQSSIPDPSHNPFYIPGMGEGQRPMLGNKNVGPRRGTPPGPPNSFQPNPRFTMEDIVQPSSSARPRPQMAPPTANQRFDMEGPMYPDVPVTWTRKAPLAPPKSSPASKRNIQ